jgi:uncharacterized membrane protein
MTKKPKSSQLWDIYFFIIGIVSVSICISMAVPGLLSARSTMTNIGGLLLMFAILMPLLLIYFVKLVRAIQKLIETKKRGQKNEESSIWN